ncbi:PLC-like phosphodiesterase [Phakopsora pachyrhizi]|uniref:Phosphoinositide phospholipase C n=1 Tax=Phakopsora pachyrhizi TaxID=170000 RepID=A0AAV0AUL0_PHAPC|nr:PLC-like phosphodiesterase [Phakopsora pachyrhizi]
MTIDWKVDSGDSVDRSKVGMMMTQPINETLHQPDLSKSTASTASTSSPSSSSVGVVVRATSIALQPSSLTSSSKPSRTRELFDVQIPDLMRLGTTMLKVSSKKSVRINVMLDYERGQLIWESKKGGSLNIESIREIRYREGGSYYRNQFKLSDQFESNWMTIVYLSKKSRYKMLHLICLESNQFEIWKDTLDRILSFRIELLGGLNHLRKRQAYWLKQHWNEADTAEDSKLEFHEIVGLCRRLNISVPESDIRSHFDLADSQRRGYLDFQAFQHFVRLMKHRTELDQLFSEITEDSALMTLEQFTKFMVHVQRSKLSQSTIEMIYKKFSDDDQDLSLLLSPVSICESSAPSKSSKQMTIDGFTTFLQSSDNSAMVEDHLKVCQDMNLPLCDYFVSTSHNTYLVGNQLKGQSTLEGYIRALQEGCRSVELDCWDGDSGEPVVYHGRTLTSKLLLAEALKVISKYAFVASPYPLILSLEVHCQPSQQERIAELLKTCLGKSLLDKRLDGDVKDSLPSPKQLMYRILVKAKKQAINKSNLAKPADIVESEASTSTTSGSSTSSDSDLKRIISTASSAFGHSIKRISSAISTPSNSSSHEKIHLLSAETTCTGSQSNGSVKATKKQLSPPIDPLKKIHLSPLTSSLSDLLIYTVGVKARGFNKLTKYDVEHVLSLSERTVNKFLRGGTLRVLDLISHTKGHLTRAYPSATRVFSSNFIPNRFWAAGIQLVACNWQTYDLGMQINMAFFNQNGRSGYILKPITLRTKTKEKEAAVRVHEYRLKIKIISVQQLPGNNTSICNSSSSNSNEKDDSKDEGKEADEGRMIDPVVEVQLISTQIGSSNSIPSNFKRRTKPVKGNGFNPIFNEEFIIPFEVPGEMIELSFLRLIVLNNNSGDSGSSKDDDSCFIGSVCHCFGSLASGPSFNPLHIFLCNVSPFPSHYFEKFKTQGVFSGGLFFKKNKIHRV